MLMRLLDPVKISVTRWTVKFKTLTESTYDSDRKLFRVSTVCHAGGLQRNGRWWSDAASTSSRRASRTSSRPSSSSALPAAATAAAARLLLAPASAADAEGRQPSVVDIFHVPGSSRLRGAVLRHRHAAGSRLAWPARRQRPRGDVIGQSFVSGRLGLDTARLSDLSRRDDGLIASRSHSRGGRIAYQRRRSARLPSAGFSIHRILGVTRTYVKDEIGYHVEDLLHAYLAVRDHWARTTLCNACPVRRYTYDYLSRRSVLISHPIQGRRLSWSEWLITYQDDDESHWARRSIFDRLLTYDQYTTTPMIAKMVYRTHERSPGSTYSNFVYVRRLFIYLFISFILFISVYVHKNTGAHDSYTWCETAPLTS